MSESSKITATSPPKYRCVGDPFVVFTFYVNVCEHYYWPAVSQSENSLSVIQHE